jgi:hypothetical protein
VVVSVQEKTALVVLGCLKDDNVRRNIFTLDLRFALHIRNWPSTFECSGRYLYDALLAFQGYSIPPKMKRRTLMCAFA